MSYGLRMAGTTGLLLASLLASPTAARAAVEERVSMSKPAVGDPVWNAAGQLIVDVERLTGNADGAPE
jgi:ABC-type sugar transport system substrate-binding protein